MKAAGRRKLLWVLAFVLIMAAVPTGMVYATSTQEKLNQAQEDKKQTQSQMNETKDNLKDLKEEKNVLEGQLADLNEKLTVVSNNLNELEKQISAKEDEIEITQEELTKARETEQVQYESMKARIRFMYERSDYALLETLLGSGSLAEALNKADYVEQVAAYDRKKLDEYEATRMKVQEEETKLKEEKEELDALKEQIQAEKNKVNTYVKQTSTSISATASEISNAEAEALAYEAKIKEQEANIEYLKKKLAEEQSLSKLAAQSSWRDISEIQFEESDRYLLANLIYCEAGGEPYAGQLAVGAVVMNRVLSSVYPNTVSGVIYQKYQFSPVGSGRLALAMSKNKATASCYKAADEAMAGQTNVGNCVYFRTPIPGLTGIKIGGHIFY